MLNPDRIALSESTKNTFLELKIYFYSFLVVAVFNIHSFLNTIFASLLALAKIAEISLDFITTRSSDVIRFKALKTLQNIKLVEKP